MKSLITCVALCLCVSTASAGECVNGSFNLRSRTVTVARELISVPVQLTRRTVEATRNVGRRTVARVRSVVR
jgi:uncharacterized protein involved in propanediol utilization